MEQPPPSPGHRAEQRFWSELISAQLDSWEPRSLPASFRPRGATQTGNRRLVPVLAMLVVLLLVAIAVFTDTPRGLVNTVVNIGRPHTSATPSEQLPATAAPRSSHAAGGGGRPSPTGANSAPRSTGPTTIGTPAVGAGGPGDSRGPGGPGAGGQPGVPAAPVAPPPIPSLPVATPPLPLPSLPPLPSVSPPALPSPVLPLPSLATVPTPALPTPPLPGG
ncbi:MAG: hypothetical protein DLM67_12055 [Candidatus Nephthysia bennettiae]|uniref:Uncharacterized protein n=1 Tax=Candidatus Nephthysia bennettiae TaxID=3127016 RepID=A0A934K0E0_9BACT|nr:hypothetical protein [Candidatus Dormibacteraeota bacterium]MBJ7610988.1 hypothetical protein [Candidatus Dormibacteraeota bacterium]PZR94789.1 MAG: hypothetical protein DLM67_12055 [Candidatus Dormibacteraeota bacterium]